MLPAAHPRLRGVPDVVGELVEVQHVAKGDVHLPAIGLRPAVTIPSSEPTFREMGRFFPTSWAHSTWWKYRQAFLREHDLTAATLWQALWALLLGRLAGGAGRAPAEDLLPGPGRADRHQQAAGPAGTPPQPP